MKIAVVSDIHGNLAALEAVLQRAGPVDGLWCLGDVVGYGPEPNECVERMRELADLCVLGNHDSAAIGRLDVANFNIHAATAALWTAGVLTAQNRRYLEELPERAHSGHFTLVHGSPRLPVWEYVMSAATAALNLGHFTTDFCLLGHTHVPVVHRCGRAEHCVTEDLAAELSLRTNDRLLINPGSVGQPRDRDPRAAFAVLDTEAQVLWHYRVDYDVASTQEKMRQLGLPEPLAQRLSYGL